MSFLCDSLGNIIGYSHCYHMFDDVTEGFQSAVWISGNVSISYCRGSSVNQFWLCGDMMGG